jgi:flagellar hook assembly protein FlgD
LEGAINEKNSTKEIRFTPSPFQSQTSIELPAGNNYLIHIFNINGQKIRNLSSSLNSEGMHRTTWDGKTDEGFNVPSGVYFVVATDSFSTYSGKVIKM